MGEILKGITQRRSRRRSQWAIHSLLLDDRLMAITMVNWATPSSLGVISDCLYCFHLETGSRSIAPWSISWPLHETLEVTREQNLSTTFIKTQSRRYARFDQHESTNAPTKTDGLLSSFKNLLTGSTWGAVDKQLPNLERDDEMSKSRSTSQKFTVTKRHKSEFRSQFGESPLGYGNQIFAARFYTFFLSVTASRPISPFRRERGKGRVRRREFVVQIGSTANPNKLFIYQSISLHLARAEPVGWLRNRKY